jgi:glycosyltransferase involved in cell wall biosynthesis
MTHSPGGRRPIAILIPSLGGGGAERAMLIFAEYLLHRGQAVDVVVVRASGLLAGGVPRAARTVALERGGVLAAIPSLSAYLRRTRPRALYSTMAHCNLAALLASRLARTGVPVVVREAVVPLSGDHATTISGRVIRRLVPRVYPWAHAIVAVSGDVADELLRISPRLRDRLAVLPTPVVTARLLAEAAQPLDDPWFVPGAPPVVMGMGRLDPQKDFPTLLRAFARVRTDRPLRLLVLGAGPERARLQTLARELRVVDDVVLPGFVGNPFPYLARAAVFVLSSRYEGLPNALLQAMALGTPVVSTDCPGGPRDILQDGRYGALVPTGDAAALARVLAATLGSPRRPDAAAYVRERFGAAEACARYLHVLEAPGAIPASGLDGGDRLAGAVR